MKLGDIGNRMLLVAVAPVLLLSVLATLAHTLTRMGDLSLSHQQQARALTRQLAATAEYGVFAGNKAQLQTLAQRAMLEEGVRAVRFESRTGEVLVSAGFPLQRTLPVLSAQPREWFDDTTPVDTVIMPILAGDLGIDDVFAQPADGNGSVLGRVITEFSRDGLSQRKRGMLWIGLGVSVVGVLFGSLLAIMLARGVNRPVLRVLRMIERLARGEMGVRGQVLVNDPLQEVQAGLNRMAESLEATQQELQTKVDQATQALREQRDAAEQATQDKSRFLAAASHDLRQPMHALGLFVDRLTQLPCDAEAKPVVQQIAGSVQALQHLLDELLDLSQLDSREVQVHPTDFALSDLFTQLLNEQSLSARSRGLRLRVRQTSVRVHTDPRLLYRILANLLGNALRYTHQGGVMLACRVDRDDDWVRLQVRDSGVGIAPQYQAMVFQEFRQLTPNQPGRLAGHGLGLSIVARLVDLLGLHVELRSEPQRGTTITVRVPRANATTTASLQSPSDLNDALRGRRVLLVEDDTLAQAAVQAVLESWGMQVVLAGSLGDTLHLLHQGVRPDVVVSDYQLPGEGDGLGVIRHVRSICGPGLPACIISGDDGEVLGQLTRQAGLTLLPKPVRPAHLRTLLQRLLQECQPGTSG